MEIILGALYSTAANKVIAMHAEYRVLRGADAVIERAIWNLGHLLLSRTGRGGVLPLSRVAGIDGAVTVRHFCAASRSAILNAEVEVMLRKTSLSMLRASIVYS